MPAAPPSGKRDKVAPFSGRKDKFRLKVISQIARYRAIFRIVKVRKIKQNT